MNTRTPPRIFASIVRGLRRKAVLEKGRACEECLPSFDDEAIGLKYESLKALSRRRARERGRKTHGTKCPAAEQMKRLGSESYTLCVITGCDRGLPSGGTPLGELDEVHLCCLSVLLSEKKIYVRRVSVCVSLTSKFQYAVGFGYML